jgi:DNA-binding NarL/FixJ family response regulator
MKTTDQINIILADDHEIFRDGFRVMIKKIPGLNLIGEASNGQELVALSKKLHPDVIITDIKMPVMDGIDATKQLSVLLPGIGIIALSMFDEENLIVDMLEAGARGYMLKNASKDEIITAIKTVHNNQTYFCVNTSARLTQMIAQSNYNPYKKSIKPVFTEKEVNVIKLICQEYSNKEIADMLSLSKRTVEGYREKILEKINAKNTVGIVVYAIKHKIYEYRR